jgi:hypothetical protein
MCKSFLTFNTLIAMGTQLGLKRHRESLFISVFLKTIASKLLSVITIHITKTKIHISYSENHDFTLMLVFYYVYVSPLSTHAHIIAKGAFKWHRKYQHSSQHPEKP